MPKPLETWHQGTSARLLWVKRPQCGGCGRLISRSDVSGGGCPWCGATFITTTRDDR